MRLSIMAANKPSSVHGSGSSWTKWQIAIAIGAPVALGLGYWYYRTHRNNLKRFDSREAERGDKTSSTVFDNQLRDGNGEEPFESDSISKAQGMKNKGNKFFKAGKYDEAIKCYSEAIATCPAENKDDIATFYQNRAAAYEQLKNFREVIEDCTKALELNCRYSKALNRRAKAYEFMNNLQSCLEDVTAVCILEGFQNQGSLLMADRVLKQLGRDRAQEAIKKRQPVLPSSHFMKSYFSSFSNDPIINPIKTELDIDAADLSGFMKARQDLKQHRFDNVVDDCSSELANSNTPFKAEAMLLRSTFYIFRGQGGLAAQDLEEVVDMNCNEKIKVNALIKLGSLKVQEDRPDKALEYFAIAEKLDPDNCDIYHHRGQINLMMDNMENALQDFAKAVELNPTFPIAYVQKCYADCRFAFVQRNLANVQQGIEIFEEAIRKFPACVEGYALYGQILTERQEYDKADQCFEKALKLDSDNANILVHRGLLKLQWKQDVNGAINLINEAVKLDDKCEFAYETLGTLEVQRGNLERAMDLFNKAIALAKTEAEMAHLYSLNDAALAQAQVAKRLGIQIPQSI